MSSSTSFPKSIYLSGLILITISSFTVGFLLISSSQSLSLSIVTFHELPSICLNVTVGLTLSTTSISHYSHATTIMHLSIVYSLLITHLPTITILSSSHIAYSNCSLMIVFYLTLVSIQMILQSLHSILYCSYSHVEIYVETHLYYSLIEISLILSLIYSPIILLSILNLMVVILLTFVILYLLSEYLDSIGYSLLILFVLMIVQPIFLQLFLTLMLINSFFETIKHFLSIH